MLGHVRPFHSDMAYPHPLICSLKKKYIHCAYSLIRSSRHERVDAHPPAPLHPAVRSSAPRRALHPTAPRPIAGRLCAPSQSHAPLAPSSFVRPHRCCALLPPPWPLGHTCCVASGLLWSSQGHSRASPVLVVLMHHGSAPVPTPRLESTGPDLPLPYVPLHVCLKFLDVCCNYFILMLQK
jgi:hypothetical protein